MKKLLLAVAIAATIFAATRGGHHQETSGLAFDRVWIDHMPRGERDPIEVFVAIDDHAIGEFFSGTRWAGKFVAFKYEANGSEVRATFPQSGKRETLTVDAKACDARGFDYCLDITGSEHGAKRYYSQKDWVIDRSSDVESKIQSLFTP